MKNLYGILTVAVGLLGGIQGALAGSASTVLEARMQVQSSCSITASAIDFPTYNPLGGQAVRGDGSLTTLCTRGTRFEVALNDGTGGGTAATGRLMTTDDSSGDTLMFNLYRDSARSQIWGEDDGMRYVGNGNGIDPSNAVTPQVFAEIPANQTVAEADYSSTITATLTF